MTYDPKHFKPPADGVAEFPSTGSSDGEQLVYLYSDPIILAVNTAIATRRPLLVAGPPGSGKSTLAKHVAAVNGWRYVERVIISRTQADDLLAGFDALRRLNDAQVRKQLLPDAAYVEPGVLWWAYDPESAVWRGTRPEDISDDDRARFPPADDQRGGTGRNVVVLLDEIDKADPDVPNDLLEPLDRGSFRVRYLPRRRQPVEAQGKVLVIITTNGERDLPPAFMRRCVTLTLEAIPSTRLVEIATAHYGDDKSGLYTATAELLKLYQTSARQLSLRQPSTAEYLDTVRTCRELKIKPNSPVWEDVAKLAMWKHETSAPAAPLGAGATT